MPTRWLWLLLTSILLISSAFTFSTLKSITGKIIAVITNKPYDAKFSWTNIDCENITCTRATEARSSLYIFDTYPKAFVFNVTVEKYRNLYAIPYAKILILPAGSKLRNSILLAVCNVSESCDKYEPSLASIIENLYKKHVSIKNDDKQFCVLKFVECWPSDAACSIWYNLYFNESYYLFVIFPQPIESEIYELRVDAGVE